MKKKLLATMAVVPLLGTFGATGVLAATTKTVDTTTQVEGDNDSNTDTVLPSTTEEVTVKIQQASTFEVVIPKTITLEKDSADNSGKTYKESYTVEVTGNINGSETVEVKPVESGTQVNNNGKVNVELNQNGKTPLTAEVEQTDTTAVWTELENDQTKELPGTIKATNVTAGSWTGTFDFNISLK